MSLILLFLQSCTYLKLGTGPARYWVWLGASTKINFENQINQANDCRALTEIRFPFLAHKKKNCKAFYFY